MDIYRRLLKILIWIDVIGGGIGSFVWALEASDHYYRRSYITFFVVFIIGIISASVLFAILYGIDRILEDIDTLKYRQMEIYQCVSGNFSTEQHTTTPHTNHKLNLSEISDAKVFKDMG